ncbi:hypothetical protein [Streptomyces erythrochromogenes]|uniref:hypothetical protein n=1 Tax=Streptomyces erythrochromogenes TaxID=285574 RepID=UPI003701E8A1
MWSFKTVRTEPEPEPDGEHGQLLEVEPVHDVVELWSSWHNGARPTAAENCEAVIHYAEYDAYLGVRS